MLYRLWYYVRETLVSLWRNLSLTLAAILTVAISLSLVGASLLIVPYSHPPLPPPPSP